MLEHAARATTSAALFPESTAPHRAAPGGACAPLRRALLLATALLAWCAKQRLKVWSPARAPTKCTAATTSSRKPRCGGFLGAGPPVERAGRSCCAGSNPYLRRHAVAVDRLPLRRSSATARRDRRSAVLAPAGFNLTRRATGYSPSIPAREHRRLRCAAERARAPAGGSRRWHPLSKEQYLEDRVPAAATSSPRREDAGGDGARRCFRGGRALSSSTISFPFFFPPSPSVVETMRRDSAAPELKDCARSTSCARAADAYLAVISERPKKPTCAPDSESFFGAGAPEYVERCSRAGARWSSGYRSSGCASLPKK